MSEAKAINIPIGWRRFSVVRPVLLIRHSPPVLFLALHPTSLWACAACYGQSDSPMAKGMNWGIFSLLAVVVSVLGGIAAFFVFLARKCGTVSGASASEALIASPNSISLSSNNV